MSEHFVAFFILLLSIGYYFQISESYAIDNIEQENVGKDINLIPRQEEDDYEEDERKQVVSGIGNILTGAFGLNLNKILKGAFSFADEDVQNNILNKLFFQKPVRATTLKSVTNETINPNNTGVTRRRRSTAPADAAVVTTALPGASASTVDPDDEDEDS